MNISRRNFFDLFSKSVPAILIGSLLPSMLSKPVMKPEVKPVVRHVRAPVRDFFPVGQPVGPIRSASSMANWYYTTTSGSIPLYGYGRLPVRPKTKKEMLQDDYLSLGTKDSKFDEFERMVEK